VTVSRSTTAAVKEMTTALSRLTSVRQSVAEWQRQQRDHQRSTQTDLLSTQGPMTLMNQVGSDNDLLSDSVYSRYWHSSLSHFIDNLAE